MASPLKTQSAADIAHTLLNYSAERRDLLAEVALLPQDENLNRGAIEYELQVLKFVSVGWGLSYFLEDGLPKSETVEAYWNGVQAFAQAVSTMASRSGGNEIDYFNVIKERLDIYLRALETYSDASEPASVIGPMFSLLCGTEENREIIIMGSRMFNSCLAAVKSYLDSVEIAGSGIAPN